MPDGPVSAGMAVWPQVTGLGHVIHCPLLVEREVVGLLGAPGRGSVFVLRLPAPA